MGERSQTPAGNADEPGGRAAPRPAALPPRLADPVPVVAVGTTVWLLAVAALLVARFGFGMDRPLWLWTAVSGAALGFVGYGIIRWQRAAARRGSRNAQRGL